MGRERRMLSKLTEGISLLILCFSLALKCVRLNSAGYWAFSLSSLSVGDNPGLGLQYFSSYPKPGVGFITEESKVLAQSPFSLCPCRRLDPLSLTNHLFTLRSLTP
uniref:Uncharacterized protein n=1 Tax=Sphaerodactylus townsendi TaxID=933632 RepID=A0ACB8F265_9SAUR